MFRSITRISWIITSLVFLSIISSACVAVGTEGLPTLQRLEDIATPTSIPILTKDIGQFEATATSLVEPKKSQTLYIEKREIPSQIMDLILMDLSIRLRVGLEEINILKSVPVVWKDGSMDCPQPGVVYPQIQVDGYWVVLEVEGREYDYRATSQGAYFLCKPAFYEPDPIEY